MGSCAGSAPTPRPPARPHVRDHPGRRDQRRRADPGAVDDAALPRGARVLWILDPVPAWAPTFNHLSRLAGSPKHHLADPALAARLLGVDVDALLSAAPGGPSEPRDGPLLGKLFESLVTLTVRVLAQAAEARIGHLRTHSGDREVDLVIERADHRIVAIEVKLGASVGDRDVRHLHWLDAQLGSDLLDMVVVTTGQEAYRRPDGVAVVPAALLGP